eukprot:m.179339 g.179339  ORF g.179339 m.179339 type:complete len:802 (-) comp31971_c0_seq3:129-2534(-)
MNRCVRTLIASSMVLTQLLLAVAVSTPNHHASLVSWAAPTTSGEAIFGQCVDAAMITTNAPVLRWNSTVATPTQTGQVVAPIFSFRINVSVDIDGDGDDTAPLWTDEVYQQSHAHWRGLTVYQGPSLMASTTYRWSVEERFVALKQGYAPPPAQSTYTVVGAGCFQTISTLSSARDEAAAEMASTNVTALWQGSVASVQDRIRPSGFLPTSVSNGYGGITSQFVRDASGQLIGLMQIGSGLLPLAERALEFMLSTLNQASLDGSPFLSYAPHVMNANKNLTKILGFDTRDQTDDTFYLIVAWGRYLELSLDFDGDLAKDYYPLLKNYTLHYLAPGARSFGYQPGSKDSKIGGNVLYWNDTLSLLWNANLEHSRLGSYWSCYDALTNSFAIEALRHLTVVAQHQNHSGDAEMWSALRDKILLGLNTSLTFAHPEITRGSKIYAELRGHPNDFSEDKDVVGFSPLLWGLSYENIVPQVLGLSAMDTKGSNTNGTMAKLGLDVDQLDATWAAIRRLGSFQWITEREEFSAFVPTTHVNSSGWITPPVEKTPPPSPSPSPSTPCDPSTWLQGKAALTLGTGLDLCQPRTPNQPCSLISTPAQCCEMCASLDGGTSCGDWFFNGNTTLCGGHGCCYLKHTATPDHITAPNAGFYAGKNPNAVNSAWCDYTGSYSSAPSCPAYNDKTCACPSFAVIGKQLGWELGWAAFRQDWTRLIVLHRWLGSAAHVEQTTLFGESYNYDCIKQGEQEGFSPSITNSTPRGANCWGDPGNGVQIGWFLWGEALARNAAGVPTVDMNKRHTHEAPQ